MHVHVYLRDSSAEVVRAAGIMCVAPDGRMLFLKRSAATSSYPETWCWPGGSIEDGESPVEAARRETREEAGTSADWPLRLIDTRSGFVTYRADLAEPFEPRLNGEHTEAVWALPDQAPSPLHPGVAATLGHVAAV
ncbi:NUDIX hydrolase [Novosphingobium sp. NDB2Meth1]|uniref:NUDIX hydrolase n=1 Tax=Novosphingobium sp. NDB2Meth1 TaxID=1892847 RepID=UPI00093131E6|nr:NUDIX hydrolase [Novosphingobium sp. NDB2Meth1]